MTEVESRMEGDILTVPIKLIRVENICFCFCFFFYPFWKHKDEVFVARMFLFAYYCIVKGQTSIYIQFTKSSLCIEILLFNKDFFFHPYSFTNGKQAIKIRILLQILSDWILFKYSFLILLSIFSKDGTYFL